VDQGPARPVTRTMAMPIASNTSVKVLCASSIPISQEDSEFTHEGGVSRTTATRLASLRRDGAQWPKLPIMIPAGEVASTSGHVPGIPPAKRSR